MARSSNYDKDGKERLSHVYSNYKSGAIRRGFDFSLTKDEVRHIASSNCHYCGANPPAKGWNGIDRVDSSIGYLEWNIVPCCTLCNRMKSDLPLDIWLEHINRVAAYQKGK